MKKFFLLVVAAVMLSASTLFAEAYETTVSYKIKAAFDESFTGAKDVKWYTEDNKTFTAKFTISNNKVTAFFDTNGDLLATSRYIQQENLPLQVINSMMKKYPDNNVYCVVEYTSGTNVVYMITLVDDQYWTVLRADTAGNLKQFSRLKKA
ncbi:hypothetical protein [Chitinophaga vietnamensis]|uniref:hypothetical protein n=1 Tax=Chitinophaga vietnamensis TaxID=2593957 RepID=UPI001177428A|nr:hypothetical protein [Chitinophaga vietnamensis]